MFQGISGNMLVSGGRIFHVGKAATAALALKHRLEIPEELVLAENPLDQCLEGQSYPRFFKIAAIT